ncbi:MAG: acyl-CoA dehydrogenase [Betaproteobacteria bacterium]|nr:acyl-CoA dehydrogenase [Betaproteobacteria bacterium]
MRLEFTPEDEAFRKEVAQWMRLHLGGRFAPLRHRGGAGDDDALVPLRKEWERELSAGRWTCVAWPQEWGGRGLTIERQLLFHEEYARAGAPGRIGHIGEGLIGPTLLALGTEAQKARFLPAIAAGTAYWCQGYSEPGAGSDLANVQTRAVPEPDGGGWRIHGQKVWTSWARESDWIFVLARSEPGSSGQRGLSLLLLPLAQPGIEIRPIRQITGGAEFNEIFFDGARAAAGDVVGRPGEGWAAAMALLGFERGASTLGQQMQFAGELELVIRAAKANGAAQDPHLRGRIAQAWSGLRVMRYNALRMLSGPQDGSLRPEAMIYKYYWSNWHRDLGKLALDVLGIEGDVRSDDPVRSRLQHMALYARADTIYAGSNEIQLNLIAERALGMPRARRPTASG